MILRHKDTRKRRIASVGMMDGVHAGHRFLIEFLCAQGEQLQLAPAIVTFDDHPLTTVCPERAPKLLTTPERKLAMLDDSAAEDVVVLNFNHRMSRMSARSFLKMLHSRWGVDALVVGFNNRFGRDRAEGIDAYRAIGQEIGMRIIEAPELTDDNGDMLSSSVIRRALEQGDIDSASVKLGRPYILYGEVVHGQALGRKLGFPTANISVESARVLVPATGVYAGWIHTPDGNRLPAMVNIGVRPTVSGPEAEPTIEAHIIDFSGELYGAVVALEFAARVRDERKFGSLEALTRQLHKDRKQVMKLLEPVQN